MKLDWFRIVPHKLISFHLLSRWSKMIKKKCIVHLCKSNYMVLNSKSVISHFLACQKSIACNLPFYPAEGRRVWWKPDIAFRGVGFSSALSDETKRFSAHPAAERCDLSLHFNVAEYLLIVSIIKILLFYLFFIYYFIICFLMVWFNSNTLWSLRKAGALQNISHLSKYLKSDSQIRSALPGKQYNYFAPKMLLSLIKIKCCVM